MSEGAPASRDAQIAQLASLTGVDAVQAEGYLDAANGDLTLAASLFFDQTTAQADHGEDEEGASDTDVEMAAPNAPVEPQPVSGGGRTLGGAYVPPTAASSSSAAAASSSSSSHAPAARRQAPQRGLRTLKDLQAGGSGGPTPGGANSDDGQDDEDDSQDFFAGGEKSGLAVQNPNAANPRDHINNILKRARQNAPRPGGDDAEPQPASHFRGAGTTLGGDDAPSRTIPDPAANRPAQPVRARRELHLWRDGFSVDDGDLYRYDDPANARTLEMINTGHAPLHILNVEHGQEVDVEVHAHKDEDYKQPKKKYVPFSGSGNRLGSPTPAAAASPMNASAAVPSTPSAPAQPSVQVDASLPTLTLQIRLGDGTRLQSRFNTTHTVGDVYEFVARSSAESQQRDFALMTTFPSKELTDKTQLLGEMGELKRGGVVVQKWK